MKAHFDTYLNRDDEDFPVVCYYGAYPDELFIDGVLTPTGANVETTDLENQQLRDECQEHFHRNHGKQAIEYSQEEDYHDWKQSCGGSQ